MADHFVNDTYSGESCPHQFIPVARILWSKPHFDSENGVRVMCALCGKRLDLFPVTGVIKDPTDSDAPYYQWYIAEDSRQVAWDQASAHA